MSNKKARVRPIEGNDIARVAQFEKEIAEISFGDEAITDLDFHARKIEKSIPREGDGMLVLELENQVIGWLWMATRENFHTGETYANFKSLALAEDYRGTQLADQLLEAGLEFCRTNGVKRVVGKVHVENLAMRVLYKNHGFRPTHMTMEMDLVDRDC